MNRFYDAFISYGRADSKAFATQLYEQLIAQGLQIWFDQNDIPLGVDFQQQIDNGIENAHNFIFIISPHSVNSTYCAKEIEQAVQHNKRIFPIMQVEEIGYGTWKARNPGKSPDHWKSYKSGGLHSSYPNMPPSISKLNWIDAQAGVNDFETVLKALTDFIHHHEDYVQQHTELLLQALTWNRHQRQTTHLLKGEDRRQAQTWLTTTFETDQPPCLPTNLQAEFITESIKAADGGMTQVFISYAEEDEQIKETVRYHLLQEGITVWANTVDIRTGEDFETAIQRGVQEADTVVYLLSQAALISTYCQIELDLALKLNKRIIPMLVETIDLSQIPDSIRKIQFINLTDNHIDLDLERDLAELQRTVRQEATYYNQHKRLLVRALKWEQQQQNPTLLLRRQLLKQYTAWAQMAKSRTLQSILPLQQAFLAASEQQPPEQTLGVFISHHVQDLDFSEQLNETLLIQGKSTWFTPEGAEGDIDTLEETHQAIDNAENFILVLSPSAIRSKACLDQLAYAQLHQKRIIPIAYRDILQSIIPEEIKALPWRDFRRNNGDFLINFGELFRTLESDPLHVRSHTRLLVKAAEWNNANRDDSFLLRGQDLSESEEWLQQVANRMPQPTELQRSYIQASQALPFKKIKLRTVAIATVVTGLLISAIRLFGGIQPLETLAYDQFLKLRPSAAEQDERLLIVKVDSDSGKWIRQQIINGQYQPGIGTIPEAALNEALAVLETHGARLIGLDFYRDFPAIGPLAQRLAQTNNLFGICQSASRQVADIPALDIPASQIGFNNVLQDGGKIIRRQYLNQWNESDPSICVPQESFSLLLAKTYLESDGIAYQDPYADEFTVPLQLGDVTVPEITGNGTAYSSNTDAWGWSDLFGYQTLLNYRIYQGKLEDFAEQVSLEALVRNEVPPQLIQDRIVLIGYTDFSDRNSDDFNTPYGDSIPGVYLQGQMISQLINAVLEDRPLIRWWPFIGETGWVLLWSGVGGVVFWGFVRPRPLLFASLGSLAVLTLSCYGFLVLPVIWAPWIPALLGWGITGGAVGYLTDRLRKG